MRYFLFVAIAFCLNACKTKTTKPVTEATKLYTEQYRPQFHFSPPEKWMNDPNGLVYHNGTYHLFYQHYPKDIVWGPMHWGHATSTDLIKWENKPIALYPDSLGLIFSGSAVIDKMNTAGFGKNAMVAAFTYHLMEGEKAGRTDFQYQGIAYSNDEGNTWTKYAGNPVIGNDGSMKDFRDPKVFWHEETNQWIMVLVAGDRAKFYSSKNMKQWTFLSDFGKEIGAHGGVWECPDLFKMKVNDSEEEKWVLLISINPGAPNGGSGTQYFVGEFDGKSFTTNQTKTKWLDYGRDNYAGVTYNNMPNNKRLFIGWMSNWDYARNTPTEVWRSAMTIPRELLLRKQGNEFLLASQLPTQLLGYLEHETEDIVLSNQCMVNISFPEPVSQFEVELSNSKEEKVLLRLQNGLVTFDRTASRTSPFHEKFDTPVQQMPLLEGTEVAQLQLLIDHSSIEAFVNLGDYVMTNQVFPEQQYTNLEVSLNDGSAEINTFPIKSIWNE